MIPRAMRIYTRQGDDGSTGLRGGRRVQKDDLRVAAYGTVDDLNAVLGWVRSFGAPARLDDVLGRMQETCFRLGAWLSAGAEGDPGVAAVDEDDVRFLEAAIDAEEEALPVLDHFVLPGGGELASRLHVARTTARRAEREAVRLHHESAVQPSILAWLNRASDLLFVLARAANAEEGIEDVPWRRPNGPGR
ncbi:MAG: cob(I)yrinic acid a,c-diamide adenosyltransferase [Planctomycetota bacterium]